MEKDITTDELLARLFKATQLKDVLENEDITQPPMFHEYPRQLCQDRGEVAERVIKRAGIDRTYGHQLFSGRRKPSRDKVIQLSFGFRLDVDETQQLLKSARHTALYPKIKRDAAIIYCLARNMEIAGAERKNGKREFILLLKQDAHTAAVQDEEKDNAYEILCAGMDVPK